MGSLAVLGITNDGANLVVSLLILFLLVFWIALIYWTYADAKRRIDDPMLVGCATAAAFFPFAGTIVYMIVRPPEYIEDKRERELDIAAAEARLASIEHLSCPYCAFDIERSFLRCPSCLRRLKEPCGTCGKPLDPRWKICPYFEADIGHAAPPPRRRERPAAAPQAPAPQAAQPQAAAHPQAPAPQADAARSRKAPRASSGTPKAAPASGNGEPARPERAASAAQRKAAPRPGGGASAPAGDGRSRVPADARPQRPRAGSRTQRPADGTRAPRPPDAAARKRPPTGARKKRAGAPPPEPQGEDEVTAEQPAARPRTRPPSAG